MRALEVIPPLLSRQGLPFHFEVALTLASEWVEGDCVWASEHEDMAGLFRGAGARVLFFVPSQV